MRKLLLGLAVLGLTGCGTKTAKVDIPEPNALATAQTTEGEIRGFVTAEDVHVWRGVRYAADTSGENRWRAPRPAPKWEGVKNMTTFAPVCPQIATPFTPIDSFTDGELEGSEDCLALDIYAPADAKDKSLPVMVWIHGGSNVSGASQLYQGNKLAANENVIVIAVQYRLGPLGWFSHPALVDSAETPNDASANFGTLDLIASLEWVRDNAQAFGGDPDNVTIFGESAGGHNVTTLLASPQAKGLFHRAIMQSGSFDSISVDEARGHAGTLLNPSVEVAERMGGPEKFHTASLDEVFAAIEPDEFGFTDVPRVIMDGVVLPETPLRDVFSSTDNYNTVPTISGINRDEMKLFNLFDERLTKTRFGQFVMARDQDFYDAASEYGSRNWRRRSVDGPLTRMVAAGHDEVYAYQFEWDEGGKLFWTDLSKMVGAAHGLEIPFVFNRFSLFGDSDSILFKKKTLKTREVLSRSMGAYWAGFARDGVPAGKDLPEWPTYGADQKVLYLDSTNDGGIKTRNGAQTVDGIVADLIDDKRIDAAQRCAIVESLVEWVPAEDLNRVDGCDIKG